jgi:PAS domain S-box-containing protein
MMKPALHQPEGRAASGGGGELLPLVTPPHSASTSTAPHHPVIRWWSRLTGFGASHGAVASPAGRRRAPSPVPVPRAPAKSLQKQLQELIGPLLTTAVIVGMVGVVWHRIHILYLPVVLVLAVAFSAFVGGTRQGLVSAGLAWVFLWFYLFAAHLNLREWLSNWLVFTTVLPGVALLTGYLQDRSREKEFKPWKGDVAPFRMASESVLDLAVVLLDREGRVTTWNGGAERVFGWSAAEMAGQALARCCDAEGIVNGTAQLATKLAAGQGRYEGEWGCARKDGSRLRAKVTVVVLRDERGQVGGYTVSAQDLSERREAASTLLRRAHQQVAVAALSQAALAGTDLGVLLDHAVAFIMQTWAVDFCGIYQLQPEGQTLLLRAGAGWNPGCVGNLVVEAGPGSMLGYALAAPEPVVVKDLAGISRFQIPEYLREHGARSGLLVVIPGRPQPFGLIGVHTRRPDGFQEDDLAFLQAVVGVLVTAQARKQSDAEAAKLAAFPQFNPNPVFELSKEGGLTYFNEAAARMAGTLGLSNASMMLPPDTARIAQECLASGASRLGSESRAHGRTLHWSFFPIPEIGRVHLYAADVTDRLELEAQLRQSQKMEAVGQLAAGVAHDFNNILTIMQGFASRLLDGEAPTGSRENAQHILDATERAASLTRQLLAFSRRQPMQLRRLDLRGIVATMTRMLERLIGENIRLRVTSPEALPAITADSGMMEQILLNLVVNARDAMPQGGELVVETSLETVEEAEARKRPQARAGKFVCLRVVDTGCGMDAPTLARIFEPFFTTKGPGKGTGLGLATVYGIVQQHQGWIEVESEPGHGTRFSILLPAAEGPADEALGATASPAPVLGGTETILVVEDEALLRELARATLEGYGYTVLEAANGLEAVAVWRQAHQRMDMLFTDLMMPGGMTGRELSQRLREDRPGLRVIFSSGYSADLSEADFAAGDGSAFLQKPYRPAELARLVRTVLDGKDDKAPA